MKNPYQAPALLRKTWLPVMLAVELVPAFMGTILLLGTIDNFPAQSSLLILAYFVPGLGLYLAKFGVLLGRFSRAKSLRIMHINGWFAAMTLLVGFGMMLERGLNLFSDGGGTIWLFMIYLACASTISFLAGTSKYDLIR